MAEYPSDPLFPLNVLDTDLVVNGMIPRAELLVLLEGGIKTQMGWGHSFGWVHCGEQATGLVIAKSSTIDVRFRALPYMRNLELAFLVDGTEGADYTVNIAVDGNSEGSFTFVGSGAADIRTAILKFKLLTPYDGTVSASGDAKVSIGNDSASDDSNLVIYGVGPRAIHNVRLEE